MKISLQLLIGLTLLSLLLCLAQGTRHNDKLDRFLNEEISKGEMSRFNIFIFPHVKSPSQQSPDFRMHLHQLQLSLSSKSIPRAQRRSLTYQLRSMIAEDSQAQLLGYLQDELKDSFTFKRSFWINNCVYLRGVNREVVIALTNLDIVREIRGEYVIATVDPVIQVEDAQQEKGQFNLGQKKKALEWNIAKIRADQAWNITRGEGVVVANIDTGVRETHEALLTSYRGYRGGSTPSVHDYNWYDPKEFANDPWWCDWGCSPQECCMDTPFDNSGHGTHTMGTIVGSEQIGIGVAPGAKWIAAKGCRDGSCLNYGLTSSAEWVICPTTIDGKSTDCTMGADVVSNSWGGGQGDLWYKEYVEAWVQAGIVPIFSQGNTGPKCGTAGSPGDFEDVIGVGATTSTDSLADFSSRGPSKKATGIGYYKPDISAPGSEIRSSSSTVGSSDNKKYSVYSGTSMAAPHVTGVVALMLSVNPKLTYPEIRDLIGKSANKIVGKPENGRTGDDICDGVAYDQLPSFHYGQGVIDAYSAVQLAQSFKN